jgi:hypothetical protein
VIAGGWYVNWWLVAMLVVGLACLVAATVAGRFRRTPRLLLRWTSLLLAAAMLGGWMGADLSGPGESLGGSPWPWSVVPDAFVYENHVWGGGYGSPDPRDAPCRSRADLATRGVPGTSHHVHLSRFVDGHLAGIFGGPSIFIAVADDQENPRWFFLEMSRNCYLTFPRFRGGEG